MWQTGMIRLVGTEVVQRNKKGDSTNKQGGEGNGRVKMYYFK